MILVDQWGKGKNGVMGQVVDCSEPVLVPSFLLSPYWTSCITGGEAMATGIP